MASMPKPTEADVEYFGELLPDDPRVTRRPMFGNHAGFVNGNMFLCLLGSQVAVRLDEPGREELLDIEGTEPFAPMPERPMREYVALPDAWRDDLPSAHAWVERSLEWVGDLPPKKKKKK